MNRRALLALAALCLAPAAALASGKPEGDKKKAGGETYLPLDPISAIVRKAGGRRGILMVDCGLDIPDEALRTRAQLSLPRLRAGFVQSVQVYAGGLGVGDAPNADFLARNLQRQTDTILGKPGAKVLLGTIMIN